MSTAACLSLVPSSASSSSTRYQFISQQVIKTVLSAEAILKILFGAHFPTRKEKYALKLPCEKFVPKKFRLPSNSFTSQHMKPYLLRLQLNTGIALTFELKKVECTSEILVPY